MIALASGHDAPPMPVEQGVLPGLVFAFRAAADGSAVELAVDRPIDLGVSEGAWLWLHFNVADARACRWIAAAPEVPAPARALLVALNDHQQFNTAGDWFYGVFADLVRDLDHDLDRIAFLNFAMSDRMVVTGRRQSLQAVEETRAALNAGKKFTGPTALMEAMVENVAAGIDRLLERLASELDRVEDMVLIDNVRDERRQLGRVRRTGVHLHRQLMGLKALFGRFRHSEEVGPVLTAAMARLAQLLEGLDHEVVALQERARLLQEEIASKLSEESARSLHTLTILTALCLPPTLVAGIFGMNTGGMPFADGPLGTLWASGLAVLSALLVYLLLRRLGIIRR
jgi:zinc transporter